MKNGQKKANFGHKKLFLHTSYIYNFYIKIFTYHQELLKLGFSSLFCPAPSNMYAIHRQLLRPETLINITMTMDKILKESILPKINEINSEIGLSKQAAGIIELFSRPYCPNQNALLSRNIIQLKHLTFLQGKVEGPIETDTSLINFLRISF